MQEQDRLAAEEAEKRLKAALTAKREPSINPSRIASPSVVTPENATESKPTVQDAGEVADVPMETDTQVPNESPSPPEVNISFCDHFFCL